MATIKTSNSTAPVTIEKFLGLNLSDTGDTQIQLGESGNMDNFYITEDYKLKKMYGYKSVYNFNTPIRGMTSTQIGNNQYLVVATNGHLYSFRQEDIDNFEDRTPIPNDLGTLTDDETRFFEFDKNLYILNGHEYKKWDGETLKDVEGYVPLIMISTTPEGTGTKFEDINLLTGKRHQQFNGDGTAKEFKLVESGLTSIDKVLVNGEETTEYTSNLSEGKVTFTTAPSESFDNVDIYYSVANEDRHFIEEMRAATIYGGSVDTRVFMFGNKSEKNRVRYSSVTADGIPSAEYFPGVFQIDVGPSNFEVTDLIRQYDILLAVTNRPDAYYMTLDTVTLDENTTTTSIRTLPLNDAFGSIAFAQGQVIENNPVTINENALVEWKATSVRSEKNINNISEKIQRDLTKLDLRNAVTLDYQTENQYWLAVGNIVYIYNYANKTYSRLKLADEVNCLRVIENSVYMANKEGKIARFSEEYGTFDKEIIKSHWEMNFYDYRAAYLRKTMQKVWILMQPRTNSSAVIGFVTNNGEGTVSKEITYKNILLDDIDFSDFSFKVSYNPQPFKIKLKAKKFTNLKITIDNQKDTSATILAVTMKIEYGGESK